MSIHPATTVKVTSIEPAGDTKVRLIMEMIVDVHELAEVGSDMLKKAMSQLTAENARRKQN
jgi:hypothetical protein